MVDTQMSINKYDMQRSRNKLSKKIQHFQECKGTHKINSAFINANITIKLSDID